MTVNYIPSVSDISNRQPLDQEEGCNHGQSEHSRMMSCCCQGVDLQELTWEAIGGVGGLDKDSERWKKRVMEDELRDPSNFLE